MKRINENPYLVTQHQAISLLRTAAELKDGTFEWLLKMVIRHCDTKLAKAVDAPQCSCESMD